MFKIGFSKIGSEEWLGGKTYLSNISLVIKSKLKGKVLAKYIKYEGEDIKSTDLKKFNECLTIERKNNFLSKFFNFILNYQLNNIIKNKLDIYFEMKFAGLFANNNKIISWIPDLQHRKLPKLFSFYDYWNREIKFRIKIFLRKNIIVSSYNSKKDCIKFYNKNPNNIHVVKFTNFTDPKKHLNKINYLKNKYKINKKFIFVPNQFWIHKNHKVIFKCLNYIKKKNINIYKKIPQIIFTGSAVDFRNKNHGKQILKKINSNKFNNKIIYLGVIPLNDVFKLNANCVCLINPSFFEGWSTTVEEAKSFGTPSILSDIPVHREQSPNSIFFQPNDFKNLSKILENLVNKKFKKFKRKSLKKIIKDQNKNIVSFSNQLYDAIRKSTKYLN